MSSIDNQSVLELFRQYKKYCLNQIQIDTTDTYSKIEFMSKVINELLDQNECLLELVAEVQASVGNKSMQMHELLQRTADKTYNVGLALSSFELEMKKLVEQNIPSFVECADLVVKVKDYVEVLEEENVQLKQQNESFFHDIQSQSIELMYFKQLTYDVMFEKQLSSAHHPHHCDDDCGYLELVLRNKLHEQQLNSEVMVCATVLDELINSIEVNNEAECPAIKASPPRKAIDINDNYENDIPASLCNPKPYVKSDSSLDLHSTLLSELQRKNSVIFDMRRELSAVKLDNRQIVDKYSQQTVQMLRLFSKLKALFDCTEQSEFTRLKSKLLREIDKEIDTILACNEYISVSDSRFL